MWITCEDVISLASVQPLRMACYVLIFRGCFSIDGQLRRSAPKVLNMPKIGGAATARKLPPMVLQTGVIICEYLPTPSLIQNILIPHQVNTPAMDPTTIDAPPSLIRDITVAAASPPTSPIAATAPPWVPHPYLEEDLIPVLQRAIDRIPPSHLLPPRKNKTFNTTDDA